MLVGRMCWFFKEASRSRDPRAITVVAGRAQYGLQKFGGISVCWLGAAIPVVAPGPHDRNPH